MLHRALRRDCAVPGDGATPTRVARRPSTNARDALDLRLNWTAPAGSTGTTAYNAVSYDVLAPDLSGQGAAGRE